MWRRDNWKISFASVEQDIFLSLLFVSGHDNERGFCLSIDSPAAVNTTEQQ